MKQTTILILCLAVAGVAYGMSPPRPKKSEYFETAGAGFLMETGKGVIYAMTYERRKPITETMYGVIEFQNPENKREPYILELLVEPGDEPILARSPLIPRIGNNRKYKVVFYLYSDTDHEDRVNKHAQKVLFSLPRGGAEQFGIELIRRHP